MVHRTIASISRQVNRWNRRFRHPTSTSDSGINRSRPRKGQRGPGGRRKAEGGRKGELGVGDDERRVEEIGGRPPVRPIGRSGR